MIRIIKDSLSKREEIFSLILAFSKTLSLVILIFPSI